MSNLSVNTITDASGGSTASINGLTPQASNMQPFNRIINGAMTIDQRNAGASVATSSSTQYTVDRWQALAVPTTKYTVQQNAGAVTPPVGFTNYLGATSTSEYSVVSTDRCGIRQFIEGYNVADLGWGTANAQPVTISFWVRSSLTGTFGGSVGNDAGNRNYPFSYAINAANTWEQKSVTIAGDTTGTWDTTTATGINLIFGLGVGSTYSDTAGAWSSSLFYSSTGAVSVIGTNGATWYITGVQLEAGSTASPFAHENYGDTLQKCQRYFANILPSLDLPVVRVSASDTLRRGTVPFSTTMRSAPTVIILLDAGYGTYSAYTTTIDAVRFSSTASTASTVNHIDQFTADAEL
jgi:hypothetical protein